MPKRRDEPRTASSASAIAAILACLGLAGCGRNDPPLGSGFEDHFERSELGPDYFNTGGPYRVQGGALTFSRVHNHPLWLKRSLPHDVEVDFDVTARSADGDLKVELFGDGKSYESDEAVEKDLIYTASGYVFIFGGWRNSRSVLVRQNEHAWQNDPSLPQRSEPRVEPGKRYHFTLSRRGGHLDWRIDGQPFLAWDDPDPLAGAGHDHFAFDGWESEAAFDDLVIKPL